MLTCLCFVCRLMCSMSQRYCRHHLLRYMSLVIYRHLFRHRQLKKSSSTTSNDQFSNDSSKNTTCHSTTRIPNSMPLFYGFSSTAKVDLSTTHSHPIKWTNSSRNGVRGSKKLCQARDGWWNISSGESAIGLCGMICEPRRGRKGHAGHSPHVS